MDYDINQSHEIEFQLIGSILKDGKVFSRIADICKVNTFHSSVCADIFHAMIEVHNAGMVVDQITIGDQLMRHGKLDSIVTGAFSGRAAISKMRDMGKSSNAESYAMTVQDYWGKREITMLAGKFATWSMNGRRAVDILSDARKLFDEVDSYVGTGNTRTVDAKTAASRSYDQTINASKGIIKFAITGLVDLDRWFKMRDGNLTIVAARPGQGKTALLITIALNNALDMVKRGVTGKVLFLSMEMTVEEVTARFLSQISRVPASQILDGQMDISEWGLYNDAVEIFEKLPIVINDLPAMTIANIRSEAMRYLKEGEDNLLIVDYLQLATSGMNKQNRVDEVGMVARGLKVYAGTTKTPVLAAAQLSRAIEARAEKRPVLSDLRESGNIEQDADNVLFLYREEKELNVDTNTGGMDNIRQVIVAKQRNGATSYSEGKGDVMIRWLAKIMRFENIAIERINL
jgi:replicative DNA helicase